MMSCGSMASRVALPEPNSIRLYTNPPGAGLEGDHVPRVSSVERGLDVAARGDGDRASSRSHVPRVHGGARTLGLSGPDRSQKWPRPECQQNVDERAMRELTRGSHVPAG